MKFQIKTNSLNFRLKNAVIKEYPELENIEITPSKEEQTFKSENYYGYDEVKVNGVTNEIDTNIKPENIKKDVSILGVTGQIEELKATELTITPSLENQVVTPEEPNNSFSEVTINKVTSEIDNNIKPENIKVGVSILGVSGNVEELNGEKLTINKNGEYTPTKPINAYTKVIADVPVGEGDPELIASYLSSIDNTLGANVTKLPNGITSIGSNAFNGCTNLALTELPSGITSIGSNAFNDCSKLALTSLPSSIKRIDNNTFNGCTNLALTELPSGITSIGNTAFSGCSKLALIELPSGITSIGTYAFQACTNLALTELPSGITSIGTNAFQNCTSLTELTALGGVTSISARAFFGCTNLAKIVFPNVTKVPTLSNTNVFTNTPIANGTGFVYFPDSLVDSIKSATNWSTYANQIKGVSEL